jgi:hypothetical protein
MQTLNKSKVPMFVKTGCAAVFGAWLALSGPMGCAKPETRYEAVIVAQKHTGAKTEDIAKWKLVMYDKPSTLKYILSKSEDFNLQNISEACKSDDQNADYTFKAIVSKTRRQSVKDKSLVLSEPISKTEIFGKLSDICKRYDAK